MTATWSHLRAQTSAVVALLAGLQAHDSAVLECNGQGLEPAAGPRQSTI